MRSRCCAAVVGAAEGDRRSRARVSAVGMTRAAPARKRARMRWHRARPDPTRPSARPCRLSWHSLLVCRLCRRCPESSRARAPKFTAGRQSTRPPTQPLSPTGLCVRWGAVQCRYENGSPVVSVSKSTRSFGVRTVLKLDVSAIERPEKI